VALAVIPTIMLHVLPVLLARHRATAELPAARSESNDRVRIDGAAVGSELAYRVGTDEAVAMSDDREVDGVAPAAARAAARA
jgi:hypothetical protein